MKLVHTVTGVACASHNGAHRGGHALLYVLAGKAQPCELPFDLREVGGFRYRVESAMSAITKLAVKETRLEELRKEVLTLAHTLTCMHEYSALHSPPPMPTPCTPPDAQFGAVAGSL